MNNSGYQQNKGISYSLGGPRARNEEDIFSRSIFISGLNYDSTEGEIRGAFQACGEIE
jgi:RNA recognition motif-containing protein